MATRRYELRGVNSKYGVTCVFGTPVTSTLEEGATNLNANVFVIRGDAEKAYAMKLDATERFRKNYASEPGIELGELHALPVGDEGYFHNTEFVRNPDAHSTATVASRAGDDMLAIDLGGSSTALGRDGASKALTEDVIYGEAVDILKALNGDSSAGEPRISPPATKEYPGLPALDAPSLAEGSNGEARCAQVTAAAKQLRMSVEKTDMANGQVPVILCHYDMGDDRSRTREAGTLQVTVNDYGNEENLPASAQLARDLMSIVEHVADESEPGNHRKLTLGPLYTLPAGQSGYMIYTRQDTTKYGSGSTGTVDAAYVVGEVYYKFRLSGATYPDDLTKPVARTEKELVADLMTVLTAMKG